MVTDGTVPYSNQLITLISYSGNAIASKNEIKPMKQFNSALEYKPLPETNVASTAWLGVNNSYLNLR